MITGNDGFVSLPIGSGKLLCYSLLLWSFWHSFVFNSTAINQGNTPPPFSQFISCVVCSTVELELHSFLAHAFLPCAKVLGIGIKINLVSPGVVQGFAESLQHCIRPQSSVTSLYGRFRAQCLPYKEITEFWMLILYSVAGFCKTLYFEMKVGLESWQDTL